MDREESSLEINLAITFLELGNTTKARGHLRRARELAERYADALLLSEVAEAEARVAFASEDDEAASERAGVALAFVEAGGSYLVAVGAYRTLGRVAHRRGDRKAAEAAFERAVTLLRSHRSGAQLRDLLAEWADMRSSWGDAAGANELYAEALGRRPARS
jgi:tetratricopeptide (TPR) repeat protein